MSKSLKLNYSNFQNDIQVVSFLGEEIGHIERVNIRYDDNAKTPFMYVFRLFSSKYISEKSEKTDFIVVPFSSMATKRSRLADWLWANIEEKNCNVVNGVINYFHLFSFLKEKVEAFEADYEDFGHIVEEDHVWDASVMMEELDIGKIYYFGSEHELNDRNRLFKSTSRSTLHKMKKMVEGLVFDELEKRAEERYAYIFSTQEITPSEATKQRHATN